MEKKILDELCAIKKLLASIAMSSRTSGKGLMTAGACDEILRNSFAGQHHRLGNWNTGLATIQLMREDPARTGFIIANVAASTVGVNITSAIPAGGGILLAATGGRLEMWQPLAGSLVQHAWYAKSLAGAFGVLIEHFCDYPGPPGAGITVVVCP